MSGSLLIGQAHSAFRIHKKNHFSKNGVLGGPYRPGQFPPELALALERSMAKHIIANIEKFEAALGIEYCQKLIGAVSQEHALLEAVKYSPKLKAIKLPKQLGFIIKIGKGIGASMWKKRGAAR